MEAIVVKPEGKDRSDGFAGETLPSKLRVQNPSDFTLAVLLIGEPQCDVSDGGAALCVKWL